MENGFILDINTISRLATYAQKLNDTFVEARKSMRPYTNKFLNRDFALDYNVSPEHYHFFRWRDIDLSIVCKLFNLPDGKVERYSLECINYHPLELDTFTETATNCFGNFGTFQEAYESWKDCVLDILLNRDIPF